MSKKIRWGCKFIVLLVCFFLMQNVYAEGRQNVQEDTVLEQNHYDSDADVEEVTVGEAEVKGTPVDEINAKESDLQKEDEREEDSLRLEQFSAFYHEYARRDKTASMNHVRDAISSISKEQITSDSEIYVEKGTKVTLELQTDLFKEEDSLVQLCRLDFSSGQVEDVSEDYITGRRWTPGRDGNWFFSLTLREEGHYKLKASYHDLFYEGPMVTVDEKTPVIESVISQQKAVKQLDGYHFYEDFPVYEIIVEEENFVSDCFSWKGYSKGICSSDWTSYYEDGVRKNRMCFTVDQEGKYDLFWEVRDAGGRNRSQGECHFVVDSTEPEITLSIASNASISRYSYSDLTYCSKKSIPICLTAKDSESGIAGIHYMYQNADGKVLEGYRENSHFTTTFSITVDDGLDLPDFSGWIMASAVNGMGIESPVNPVKQILGWESLESHEKCASVEIHYPDNCYTDFRKKIKYYKEAPEISATGIDSLSGICKSYIQASLRNNLQKEEEDYRFQETIQKKIAQKIRLSLAEMNASSEHEKIVISAGFQDHAGYEKKVQGEYSVVVDSHAPKIDISYDESRETPFYNKSRTAIVTVEDWNFDVGKVNWKISGKKEGYSIGPWQGKGKKSWCKIVFSQDGNYQIALEVTDCAGNRGSCKGEAFTIDQKAPVMHMWMDTSDVENERYYSNPKMIYVLLQEENIQKENIAVYNGRRDDSEHLLEIRDYGCFPEEYRRRMKKGGWKVYAIRYQKDAIYHIRGQCQDQAGNEAKSTNDMDFTIDKTPPALVLEDLQKNIVYTEDFQPKIILKDRYLDTRTCSIQILYSDGGVASFLKERMNRVEEKRQIMFSWDDIPKKKENDNRYLLRIHGKDLAGNEISCQNIPFYINRYGARFLLEEETEDYLDNYYHKQEEDICVRVYSLFPVETEFLILRDRGKRIPVSEKDYQKVSRWITPGDHVDQRAQEILPHRISGWYESKYRISKELFKEEGDYQISIHSTESGIGEENGDVKESENGLWTMPIRYAIDKTPPDVVLGGLEKEMYDSNHLRYTITASDNHRLRRMRLHIKKDGKDSIKDYTEESFNELDSITEELTSSNGYQYIGYEAWDYAGNYCTSLHTSEEKKVLVSENMAVRSAFAHPWYSLFVVIFVFVIFIILTRWYFFGIFKRQTNR